MSINVGKEKVISIKRNIEYLRYLKSFDHTIIIYTARRMKTYNGNIGKLMADIGKITFDTLEKFSIPYDEIFPTIRDWLDNCDYIVGHNTLGFDIYLLKDYYQYI